MKQRMSRKQKTPQQNTFHLTRYAFHEAGHALVGHVIGRCISEVSILGDRMEGYHGYCAFDALEEAWQGFSQWGDGRQNAECITIMYAGTIALRMLCEQRGWNYQRWRGIDHADFDTIYHWSIDMFDTDEERHAIQKQCQKQAGEILTQHWKAVEVLAHQLQMQGWLSGKEAHSIIWQALGEDADWRRDGGRIMSNHSAFDTEV